MNTEKFALDNLQKTGSTLKGISSLITQSFEIEAMTKNDASTIKQNLRDFGLGSPSSKGVNDGNGWNDDCHHDVSLPSYDYTDDDLQVYGTETSTSPISEVSYSALKSNIQSLLDDYLHVSGGKVLYTVKGSVHVHNTVAYMQNTNNYEYVNSVKLDVKKVYDNVGRFMIKYMPVMKWLVMTDKSGARGVRGSSYGDQFERDGLFGWWSCYSEGSDSPSSFRHLCSLGRGSAFRAYSSESIHFENRLCDDTFNATHLAMWLSFNKALTLFAIDFARNGFTFPLSDSEVETSRDMMRQHSRGFRNVNKAWIEVLYKDMISYLAKYLKITNSLDCIDVMDKLIKCPIPQYLNENNIPQNYWDMMTVIEKCFNTRNRASDDVLRDKFLHAIKSMSIPFADSLNEYLDNVSINLDVEVKKVKSLYQMFKRENIDIEFLGGRLVYLGD